MNTTRTLFYKYLAEIYVYTVIFFPFISNALQSETTDVQVMEIYLFEISFSVNDFQENNWKVLILNKLKVICNSVKIL
jgi:hypothetical protein